MSKVVSPHPPYEGDITPAPNACWWRLRLPMNDDQLWSIARMEPDQGWASFEFFDGHDTVIDTGFDKPTKARMRYDGPFGAPLLDVLSDGPPTPSPEWRQLTKPGEFIHPEDAPERTGEQR